MALFGGGDGSGGGVIKYKSIVEAIDQKPATMAKTVAAFGSDRAVCCCVKGGEEGWSNWIEGKGGGLSIFLYLRLADRWITSGNAIRNTWMALPLEGW